MKYVTFKRFRRNGMNGVHFNIPWGTVLEKHEDGILYFGESPVAVARSYAAHQHFCRDDDGRGQERGRLTQAIIKALGGNTREETPEWEAVFADALCQTYRRKEHEDYWLWDDSFFQAPMEDLEHIAALVGVKAKKGA